MELTSVRSLPPSRSPSPERGPVLRDRWDFSAFPPFHLCNEITAWPLFCSLALFQLKVNHSGVPPISLGKRRILNELLSNLKKQILS